jgi:hypothetical protein
LPSTARSRCARAISRGLKQALDVMVQAALSNVGYADLLRSSGAKLSEDTSMKHVNGRSLVATLLAGSCLIAAPAIARAAEVKDVHEAQGERDEGHNVISLKLAGLELIVPGVESGGPITAEEGEADELGEEENEVLRRVGVSIGIERVLIPGWLDAELSVLLAPGPNGLTLPIDLVLKKPFELGPGLEACIGAGLATEWYEDGKAETAYGLSTQLGGYYWVDPHWAIVLDGEYNLLLHPDTAHEVVLASGAAVRF